MSESKLLKQISEHFAIFKCIILALETFQDFLRGIFSFQVTGKLNQTVTSQVHACVLQMTRKMKSCKTRLLWKLIDKRAA